eukprot:TRINITY_DN355_c0_g1_i2.p1 TRINITY_DN355_c0_g1~~TRINITY_DN355_c0_g1_i2.p1  ORF type:complete len:148 (-),score=18.28 TRINITY_DN355_c0_g1_i2:420-839(-)
MLWRRVKVEGSQGKLGMARRGLQTGSNAKGRYFAAIVPPTYVLDTLEELQGGLAAKMSGSHVKWVSRTNIHTTLRFFGSDLDDPKLLLQANNILTDVIQNMNPFEIELQGVSVFPKWKKPRVVRTPSPFHPKQIHSYIS